MLSIVMSFVFAPAVRFTIARASSERAVYRPDAAFNGRLCNVDRTRTEVMPKDCVL